MTNKNISSPKSVDTILAVDRALLILKKMANSNEEFGVRDLSRELGYSPAVTQKILNTLRVHGFVRQNEKTDRYSLGPTTLHVGMALLSQLDIVQVARPYLEALTAETGETTFLAVLDGTTAIYVDKVVSPNPIRMDAEVGVSRPLNCTAVGKVLIAYDRDLLLSEVIASGAISNPTPNSITDPDELKKEIERVRQEEYAIDNREFHAEAICVAAPIFGPDGRILASVTTSGVATRIEDNLKQVIQSVRDVASQISAEMGYQN
jgi:IclR family acetate operon transcriptional repressor